MLTRDIERVLELKREALGLRAKPPAAPPCRRLEDAGWLRTLRAPNLQLAVELTDAGRAVAQPLLLAEQTASGQNSVRQKSSYCRWSGSRSARRRHFCH